VRSEIPNLFSREKAFPEERYVGISINSEGVETNVPYDVSEEGYRQKGNEEELNSWERGSEKDKVFLSSIREGTNVRRQFRKPN